MIGMIQKIMIIFMNFKIKNKFLNLYIYIFY